MNDWFRSWHGAPTDPKWLAIARRAKTAAGFVVAVVWTLMDRASQHADRGSIAGYDAEAMAVYLGCSEEEVEAIIVALREKGVIDGDRLSAWEKRQPKRERDGEPPSTPRVQAFRAQNSATNEPPETTERHETPRNASDGQETPRVEKNRVEKIDSSLRSESCPTRKRVRTAYPPEFEEFWKAYPVDKLMSKAEAFTEWRKLTDDERKMAVRAAPPFAAYCRGKPDYRPVHACRFLKQRRFESFGAPESATDDNVAPSRIFVRKGSAAWAAWLAATDNNGGRGYPVIQHKGQDGWWFATQYPPQTNAPALAREGELLQ